MGLLDLVWNLDHDRNIVRQKRIREEDKKELENEIKVLKTKYEVLENLLIKKKIITKEEIT